MIGYLLNDSFGKARKDMILNFYHSISVAGLRKTHRVFQKPLPYVLASLALHTLSTFVLPVLRN
jgi:hypothetical protein